jgi:hypothetical protein
VKPFESEFESPIEDVREVGPQLVVTVVQQREFDEVDRRIRITASRGIGQPRFWSTYEEDVHLTIDGKRQTLWARAALPSVVGETAEECLRLALAVVAETFGNAAA